MYFFDFLSNNSWMVCKYFFLLLIIFFFFISLFSIAFLLVSTFLSFKNLREDRNIYFLSRYLATYSIFDLICLFLLLFTDFFFEILSFVLLLFLFLWKNDWLIALQLYITISLRTFISPSVSKTSLAMYLLYSID